MRARYVVVGVLLCAAFPVVGWSQPSTVEEAVMRNDVAKLEELLAAGADPNVPGRRGRTPLCLAVGQLPALQVLLEHGADPDLRDDRGQTPLHFACRFGALDAVRLLVEAGADLNVEDERGTRPLALVAYGQHPDIAQVLLDGGAEWTLGVAAIMGNVDKAKELLAAGADLGSQGPEGETPLHSAAWYGRAEIAALLIEAGADIEARDQNGLTPLHHAAHAGQPEVIGVLLEAGADVHAAKPTGATALDCAAYYSGRDQSRRAGQGEAARRLMAAGADPNARGSQGDTALHRAAATGALETVQALVEGGCDLNAENIFGLAPLDVAHGETAKLLQDAGAKYGVEGAMWRSDLARLQEILDGGRSVNEQNIAGASLLHRAVSYAHPEVAQFLLEHGADPNITDDKGMTPLHWVCQGSAVRRGGGTVLADLAELLIAGGADMNAKDGNGRTPYDLAKETNPRDPADVLREHGAQ